MNPIRRLRKAAGLTQTECAGLAGVCQQQWSKWELNPHLFEQPTHRKIAKALGTNLVGLWLESQQEKQ